MDINFERLKVTVNQGTVAFNLIYEYIYILYTKYVYIHIQHIFVYSTGIYI